MGVGYPLDLVVCVALGVDMFDCVFPTRTARFGKALVPEGSLNLRSSQFANDHTPLCEEFDWFVAKYPRSKLHHLMANKEEVVCISTPPFFLSVCALGGTFFSVTPLAFMIVLYCGGVSRGLASAGGLCSPQLAQHLLHDGVDSLHAGGDPAG